MIRFFINLSVHPSQEKLSPSWTQAWVKPSLCQAKRELIISQADPEPSQAQIKLSQAWAKPSLSPSQAQAKLSQAKPEPELSLSQVGGIYKRTSTPIRAAAQKKTILNSFNHSFNNSFQDDSSCLLNLCLINQYEIPGRKNNGPLRLPSLGKDGVGVLKFASLVAFRWHQKKEKEHRGMPGLSS